MNIAKILDSATPEEVLIAMRDRDILLSKWYKLECIERGRVVTDSGESIYKINNMTNLDFSHTDFKFADFSGTTLINIDFYKCDFRGASFDRAFIRNVHFDGSDMTGASFNNCKIAFSTFGRTVLSNSTFFNTNIMMCEIPEDSTMYFSEKARQRAELK